MDNVAFRVQTSCMHFRLILPILLLSSVALASQQPTNTSTTTGQSGTTNVTLPADPAKLLEVIRDSYYHPDDLSSLDCAVSVDWVAFFGSSKVSLSDDRMKVLQGLKVHSHALRGKPTELTFDWSAGLLTTKDQMESGLKQMVGGFYQMYWSMIAKGLVTNGNDLKKIEPLPDGSANVDMSGDGMNLVITVSKDGSPTHWVLDSPAMKGTIDPQFTASPNPVPGDLRRISSMKVVEHIGESNINVDLSLDYQEINGLFVPKSVSFGVVGAYTIPMEFSGCSGTTAASAH
jgi:hypothetical protein